MYGLYVWGHTRFDVFAFTPDGESMKKDPEEPWKGGKVYYWQGIGGVVIVQQRRDATLLFTITCKIRKNHPLQRGCTRWRQDNERYVRDKTWLKTLQVCLVSWFGMEVSCWRIHSQVGQTRDRSVKKTAVYKETRYMHHCINFPLFQHLLHKRCRLS